MADVPPNADGDLLDTPHGPARVHRLPATAGTAAASGRATVLIGHGAGGSVSAGDIQAVAKVAVAAGIDVVLVTQPYREAGRKSAAPAKQLDVAWEAVVSQLHLGGRPLITGGRSSGARVACRTALATGADGVLCLAFPLITPKGASRQDELDGAGVPVLIVQGTSDRFGMPEPDEGLRREVVTVSGDHGLKKDLPTIADAAVAWLERLIAAAR
jgi:predicted alpha/beta-hydrolase family hydrolase